MIIVMTVGATEQEANNVRDQIRTMGLTPHDNYGTERVVIAVLGDVGPVRDHLMSKLSSMSGIESVTPISRPFKLASRETHPEDTVIHVKGTKIGDGSLTIMAGPCSIENPEMMIETAKAVAAAGATVLRGGAFKPRTSPYSFQGLGVEGLRYLAQASAETGLPTITEVMEPGQVEVVVEHSDILQVGTRNMQNYSLLTAVGKAGKPVMLKRGYGATIEEWLMAAEYIIAAGQPNVILCERGIRTFETYTRNTLDLTAVPLLQAMARAADGSRCRRGRCRRDHGGGPPKSERGAVGRRAVDHVRPVPRPGRSPEAHPRRGEDPHQGPLRHRRPGQGRRPQQALTEP